MPTAGSAGCRLGRPVFARNPLAERYTIFHQVGARPYLGHHSHIGAWAQVDGLLTDDQTAIALGAQYLDYGSVTDPAAAIRHAQRFVEGSGRYASP